MTTYRKKGHVLKRTICETGAKKPFGKTGDVLRRSGGLLLKQRFEELKPAYGGYRFNGRIYVNMASAV